LLANNDSTFQFGVFLFYASVSKPERKHNNASQRMRELLGRIEQKAIDRAAKQRAEAILIPGAVHKGKEEEDGHFYLVTPVEKVRIQVEDAPLLATDVERVVENGVAYLRFKTLTEDVVVIDEQHALWVNYNDAGEPRPYIRVRDQLDALLTRSVFYQLVEWAECIDLQDKSCYAIASAGQYFYLADVFD